MSFATIKLRPGVTVEATPVLNEAGYSASQLGRFFNGLFQKLGGWTKFYPFAVSGIPRELHAWQDLNNVQHLGVGTTTQLGVITEGSINNITPQTLTSDFAPDFTTTMGSPTVEITDPNIANVTTNDSVYFNTPISVDGIILSGLYPIVQVTGTDSYEITAATNGVAGVTGGGAVPEFVTTGGTATVTVHFDAHGLSAGASVNFPIPTTGDGVTIQGTYQAVSITDADHFTITASNQATTGATFSMNSGDAELVYYINLGPAAVGAGYGLGGYGEGGYGTGVVPSSQTGTPITATDWTEDNFGQDFIACPKNGGIYFWSPTGGFNNAALIPSAPIFNTGAFVAMPQQQIFAYGAATSLISPDIGGIGVEQDPLLIRWCDVGDFTDWIGTSDNQAGQFRLSRGSMIVGGMQAAQQSLFWTDEDLWAATYINAPLVYSFNMIAAGCGLIGQHATCQLRGTVYWMGQSNFFVLGGGGAQPIPCSVWDVVFQNLDTANQSKCRAAPNTPFNEVYFFYPSLSGGTGENDSYVKVNVIDGNWDYGTLGRSAWIDQSVLGMPIGASPQSIIYQHETTNDADGAPLVSGFTTGYWQWSEGEQLNFVDWFLPDFKWGFFAGAQTAQIQVTLFGIDYAGDTPTQYGPYTVTQSSQFFNPRIRKRFVSMQVQSSDLGSFWRIGGCKARSTADGRR